MKGFWFGVLTLAVMAYKGCGKEDNKVETMSKHNNPYIQYSEGDPYDANYKLYFVCEYLKNGTEILDTLKEVAIASKDRSWIPVKKTGIFSTEYVMFDDEEDVRFGDLGDYKFIYRGSMKNRKPDGLGIISAYDPQNIQYIGNFESGVKTGLAYDSRVYVWGSFGEFYGEMKKNSPYADCVSFVTLDTYTAGRSPRLKDLGEHPVRVEVCNGTVENGTYTTYICTKGNKPYKYRTFQVKDDDMTGEFTVYNFDGSVFFHDKANKKRIREYLRRDFPEANNPIENSTYTELWGWRMTRGLF